MADTELEQLHTAIKRQWSRVPSQKAKPYVNAFSATVRSGTKITAKVVGNHGTYTVSIQLDPQGSYVCLQLLYREAWVLSPLRSLSPDIYAVTLASSRSSHPRSARTSVRSPTCRHTCRA